MCNICFNNDIISFLVKSPLLKKVNYLDLICSVHVVTDKTGLSYCKMGGLKKWHFQDLIYSVLKSIQLEKPILQESPQKVAFFGPNMCNICCHNEIKSVLKLDGVAPLMTDPPPISSTTLSEKKK